MFYCGGIQTGPIKRYEAIIDFPTIKMQQTASRVSRHGKKAWYSLRMDRKLKCHPLPPTASASVFRTLKVKCGKWNGILRFWAPPLRASSLLAPGGRRRKGGSGERGEEEGSKSSPVSGLNVFVGAVDVVSSSLLSVGGMCGTWCAIYPQFTGNVSMLGPAPKTWLVGWF